MRILLLADTHIGFDLPRRTRVTRRRRGHDFLDNFRRALAPARSGDVDLVVHGGDLLHRSVVPPGTVEMALEPLLEVARLGVPVFLVPGNHERSRIPTHLWATHELLHVFDGPRTFRWQIAGRSLALSGFPFARDVRRRFGALLTEAGCAPGDADVTLVCMHQAVEGAWVGPGQYTFRHGDDVVRGRDIPAGIAALLTGHIHRAQVRRRDLAGRPLAAPVIYPGSVERTSWVERDETKGYVVLTVPPGSGEPDLEWIALPVRPMVDLEVECLPQASQMEQDLRARLQALPPDAVVRVHPNGAWTTGARQALRAANLRRLAPATMNVDLHERAARA